MHVTVGTMAVFVTPVSLDITWRIMERTAEVSKYIFISIIILF